MNKINLNTFSKSNIARYIVLDHSLLIEEIATETIGRLLEIDYKKSKALGSNSGSISFNQKIELIRDKIGNNFDKADKIQKFAEIRNKFAHLNTIKSWNDFFSISKDTKSIENKLNSWYKIKAIGEENYEEKIRVLYYFLTQEIFLFLININIEWANEQGKKIAQNEIKDKLFDLTKNNQSSDVLAIWDQIKIELLNNENSPKH